MQYWAGFSFFFSLAPHLISLHWFRSRRSACLSVGLISSLTLPPSYAAVHLARRISHRARQQRAAEIALFMREKQLIGLVLKFLNRDLSARVGLQIRKELIVFLHADFAGRAHNTGTESLKVHAYSV